MENMNRFVSEQYIKALLNISSNYKEKEEVTV